MLGWGKNGFSTGYRWSTALSAPWLYSSRHCNREAISQQCHLICVRCMCSCGVQFTWVHRMLVELNLILPRGPCFLGQAGYATNITQMAISWSWWVVWSSSARLGFLSRVNKPSLPQCLQGSPSIASYGMIPVTTWAVTLRFQGF